MKLFNLNLKRLALLLFIYFLLPQVVFTATCPISPSILGTTCTLTGAETYTSSQLGIPTGIRHMCFHSNILIASICSQYTTDGQGTFFRILGTYSGSGTETTLLKIYWKSEGYIGLGGVNSAGTVSTVATAAQTQPTNLQISVFACMNLIDGRVYAGINTPTESNAGSSSLTDYSLKLTNMDAFSFVFCKGSVTAYCTFTNTYFSFPDNGVNNFNAYIWGGLNPGLLRQFNIDEGSGTTLTDSNSGGTATFGSGSDAPSWSKTNYGVELTSENQYISLPGTSFAAGDDLITQSYTIMTWIRLTSTPISDSYIFRHTDSTGSQEYFAVKVASNMASVLVGGSARVNTLPINTGQWTHILATISLKSDNKNFFVSMVVDGTPVNSGYSPLNIAIPFSSSDLLTIGGGSMSVLATFYKFQIYSPGSHVTQLGSCSDPDATYSFGLTQQTLEYSCDNSCNGCFNTGASSCMNCATSSYGIYGSTCSACPTTTSKIDTLCSGCPDNCDTCSTLTTCQTCSTGYHTDSAGQCVNSTNIIIAPNCTTGYTLTSTGLCTASTIENSFTRGAVSATKGGRTAADGTTQIATIASNGDPVGVQAQVSGRIFISIQYLKITYSQDVLTILAATEATPGEGDPAYAPNIPSNVKKDITARSTPYAFNKYGLSSSFILNFWKKMMLLIIIFAVFLLTTAIEFIAIKRKWKFLPPQVFGLARQFPQSYMLSQLYSFLGDVVFYSTLQYRSLQFRSSSEWADFFVSMFFLAAVFSMPLWHFRVIMQYRRAKETAHFKKNKSILTFFQESNMGFKLFFDDFKDTFKRQQFFLMFLTGRDLIFSLILITMFDHPLPQMIIWLILNIGMMTYLFLYKPFKNVFNLVQQIFYEILLFVALIVLLILITLDMRDSTDMTTRDVLGKIIIFESLLFSYGTIVITCLKIFFTGFEAFKEYKAKKTQTTQAKYASTEEIPAIEATSPENEGEIDVSPSHRPELNTLATEEMSPQNQPYHSKASSIQSNNKSSLLLSPTQTQFIPPDLESKKTTKLKKSKTPHPSNLNREKDVNEDDKSDVIDNLMINFATEIDPNTPHNYSDASPTKAFKFMKN